MLLVTDHVSPTSQHFVCYDGNGNVTALVNASDQSLSARYEYSPFGELIRSTGTMAEANPFRWSTKFWDQESGLVYYGYRYYSPTLGRWISRDPIEELDLLNLYNALRNSPISTIDPDGRFIDMMISLAMDESRKAADALRGGAMIKRVKDLVSRLEGIDTFMDGYMTADELFEGGGLDDMIKAVNEMKTEIRGKKRLKNHRHHLIPREFKVMLKDIKKLDLDKLTAFVNDRVHLKGLHGQKYNPIMRRFIDKNLDKIKKNPMYLIGFVTGVMKNVGLGDSHLNPRPY